MEHRHSQSRSRRKNSKTKVATFPAANEESKAEQSVAGAPRRRVTFLRGAGEFLRGAREFLRGAGEGRRWAEGGLVSSEWG